MTRRQAGALLTLFAVCAAAHAADAAADKDAIRRVVAFTLIVMAVLPGFFIAVYAPFALVGLLFRGIGAVRAELDRRSYERFKKTSPRASVLGEVRNRLGGSLMSLKPAGMDELFRRLGLEDKLLVDFTWGDYDSRWLTVSAPTIREADDSRVVEVHVHYRGKALFRGAIDLKQDIAPQNRW